MTIQFDEGKPSPAEVAHSGVKGMKWGQRKRVTGPEVRAARKRVSALRKSEGFYSKKFQTSPDRVIAARLTRGEKAVALLLGGPVGAAVIAGTVVGRAAIKADAKRAESGKLKLKS